jgi:ribosome-associated protein
MASSQGAMKENGILSYRTSGEPDSGWIVVDYVDVVVHVFSEEARAYYGLEKIWSEMDIARKSQAKDKPTASRRLR